MSADNSWRHRQEQLQEQLQQQRQVGVSHGIGHKNKISIDPLVTCKFVELEKHVLSCSR